MSLEAAIIQNTETMERLIAVWNKLAETTNARPVAINGLPVAINETDDAPGDHAIARIKKHAAAASGQPTATAKTEDAAPESTTNAPAPAAQSAVAESQASTAATTITYDQVAKAITEGVKADRTKVVAALTKFGAKKGPDLKPEQWAEFLSELA